MGRIHEKFSQVCMNIDRLYYLHSPALAHTESVSMLLGLEPGYRGQDERLDRSALAAVLALLGGGISFLLAMTFLLFPEWISPRVFATRLHVSIGRVQPLPPPAFADVAWASSGRILRAQIANSPEQRSESLADAGAQPPPIDVDDETLTAIEAQPSSRLEREGGKATEGTGEGVVAAEPEPMLPSATSTTQSETGNVTGCGIQSGTCSSPVSGSAPGGEPRPSSSPQSSGPPSESPAGNGNGGNGNGNANGKGSPPGKGAVPGQRAPAR